MSADPDIIVVGAPMPRIAKVRPVGQRALAVTWAEGLRAGRTDEVDLGEVIDRYRIFEPLRNDPARFASVLLVDGGGVMTWGGNMEIAAVTRERLAVWE